MRRNNNECVYRFLNTNGSLALFPLLEHLTRILRNLSPYQPKLIREILLQRRGGFLDYTEFLRWEGNVLTNNYWAARSGWTMNSRFFMSSISNQIWRNFRFEGWRSLKTTTIAVGPAPVWPPYISSDPWRHFSELWGAVATQPAEIARIFSFFLPR